MNDIEILIRYLGGELTEEEKQILQEKLKTNSSLAEDVRLIQDIDQLVGDKQLTTFEETLKEVENIHFRKQENITSPPHLTIGRRLAIAGMISFILLSSAYFLFYKSSHFNTGDLYAQYYQKLNADFITRSNTPANDDFMKAIQFYNAGQYKDAIVIFNKILTVDPSNNAAKLFLGICYSETERFPIAIKLFQGIVNQNDIVFGEHANWYLSLCYLKMRDIPHAKLALNQLVSSKSFYVQKAFELLHKLP